MEEIFAYAKTDFTKSVHNDVYPAIDPTRLELSQAGKTIVITGGGDNLGLAVAHAFVKAGAKALIITGRRLEVLEEAKAKLEEAAQNAGSSTQVLAKAVDITKNEQVIKFWSDLQASGIVVDVMVSNAAKPPQPKPILEDVDDIWSQVETNAKAPLYMTKHLYAQEGGSQKVSMGATAWDDCQKILTFLVRGQCIFCSDPQLVTFSRCGKTRHSSFQEHSDDYVPTNCSRNST